jgi:hypothetical protein
MTTLPGLKSVGNSATVSSIKQGVGQGKIASTSNYKIYINPLLDILKASKLGIHIGTLYCGSPTCADDLILLANVPSDLQSMLDITQDYSQKERYRIHPTKSQIVSYNSKEAHSWTLGANQVPLCEDLTHLGIKRCMDSISPDSLIDDRIQCSRRTAYSLMGAGLHGTNGLPPKISLKLYSTYVMPRLLFGLESLVLTNSQINRMELFHRRNLRCIQGLPDRVASAATYLLLGETTIAAKLHIGVVCLLQTISQDTKSTLFKLALRQCALKESTSKSWFTYAGAILAQYDLPSIQEILHTRPSKGPWKLYVIGVITQYWTDLHKDEARTKSSLSWLNTEACSYGMLHPV